MVDDDLDALTTGAKLIALNDKTTQVLEHEDLKDYDTHFVTSARHIFVSRV